jgi:transcriptional regulator with XRE-family HTH domain
MEKSIYSNDYQTFLTLLRQVRKEAGLTQEELSSRLKQTQSFVSKCERGERRLDLIEARHFCLAIGIPFPEFIKRLDQTLKR